MHDSLLMQNISKTIEDICEENGIKKVNRIEIKVDNNSPMNHMNILKHLIDMNEGLVNEKTKIKVFYDNLPCETAEIVKIEGQK